MVDTLKADLSTFSRSSVEWGAVELSWVGRLVTAYSSLPKNFQKARDDCSLPRKKYEGT